MEFYFRIWKIDIRVALATISWDLNVYLRAVALLNVVARTMGFQWYTRADGIRVLALYLWSWQRTFEKRVWGLPDGA